VSNIKNPPFVAACIYTPENLAFLSPAGLSITTRRQSASTLGDTKRESRHITQSSSPPGDVRELPRFHPPARIPRYAAWTSAACRWSRRRKARVVAMDRAEGRPTSDCTMGRRHHDVRWNSVCRGRRFGRAARSQRRAWWLLLDAEIKSDFKDRRAGAPRKERATRGPLSAVRARQNAMARQPSPGPADRSVSCTSAGRPACVERRFRLISRWYPPNGGYRLFGSRFLISVQHDVPT
jgi:hypothetical protein